MADDKHNPAPQGGKAEADDVTTRAARDVSALDKKLAARSRKAPRISVKMERGKAQLTIGEKDDFDDTLALMAALGTFDLDFFNAFLGQIGNAVSGKGEMSQSGMRFALGAIVAIEPKDEIEAMLAAQMAAVHVCALDSSRRYLWAETLASRDSAERALTKLTRTFSVQMDTLKRYRAKAQQVVRVERVTVNEGGQAIVGDVTHGGEGRQ